MTEEIYPAATPGVAARRRQLASQINEAFEKFDRAVFAEGSLPEKTKQLIAVTVAHVTQRPYCMKDTPRSPAAKDQATRPTAGTFHPPHNKLRTANGVAGPGLGNRNRCLVGRPRGAARPDKRRSTEQERHER